LLLVLSLPEVPEGSAEVLPGVEAIGGNCEDDGGVYCDEEEGGSDGEVWEEANEDEAGDDVLSFSELDTLVNEVEAADVSILLHGERMCELALDTPAMVDDAEELMECGLESPSPSSIVTIRELKVT
jgi:hypothetical protein